MLPLLAIPLRFKEVVSSPIAWMPGTPIIDANGWVNVIVRCRVGKQLVEFSGCIPPGMQFDAAIGRFPSEACLLSKKAGDK